MVLHAFKIAADVPHRTLNRRRIQDVNLHDRSKKNCEQHFSWQNSLTEERFSVLVHDIKVMQALKM